jgi:hypothetical protein
VNREEAALLFTGNSQDEIASEFEAKLFELKQFFIQNVPIRKVWNSKLKKLERLDFARRVLCDLPVDTAIYGVYPIPDFSNDLLTAFNQYQTEKNMIRQKILMSSTFSDLLNSAHTYLTLTDNYASLWSCDDAGLGEVVVSKSPDDMLILNEIKSVEEEGLKTFKDLIDLPDDHVLILESKRLTLLLKMNQDAR